MSKYTIKAHPTMYRGTQFRSRLEATWAAMFDQLGWSWDYEPLDLQGWVPDFIIRGKYRDLLVEVKPTLDMAEEAMPKVLAAAPGACLLFVENGPMDRHSKSKPAGWCDQIGFVYTPFYRDRGHGAAVMALAQRMSDGIWDSHIDGERYRGFHSGEWISRMEGNCDGIDADNFWDEYADLLPLWKRAANETQWRAPK